MILKELSRILVEELGARRLVPGDNTRSVRGLAVEEPMGGWLIPGEVAVTSREALDDGFLKSTGEAGSPAVVWRNGSEPPPEATRLAAALGLGLFVVSPEVPLRRLLSAFSDGGGLLLLSHGAGRTLLESAGAEASIGGLTTRVSELLGRPVVIEDPVGRLISSSPEYWWKNWARVARCRATTLAPSAAWPWRSLLGAGSPQTRSPSRPGRGWTTAF